MQAASSTMISLPASWRTFARGLFVGDFSAMDQHPWLDRGARLWAADLGDAESALSALGPLVVNADPGVAEEAEGNASRATSGTYQP